MVRLIKHDLCTAEIGQSRGRSKRSRFEFGMRRINNLGTEFNRVLGRLACACRVARERINDTDLHIGCMSRKADGRCHEQSSYDPAHPCHWILPVCLRVVHPLVADIWTSAPERSFEVSLWL